MKKFKFLIALHVFIFFICSSFSAKAMDFTKIKEKSVYGHFDASVGMTFQFIKGDFKSALTRLEIAGWDVHKNNIAMQFGLGYDVFYSLHSVFHPLVGVEVNLRIPFYGNNVYDLDVAKKQIKEWLNVHFRFGAKFNANKNFSFLIYYLLGFNIAEHTTTQLNNKTKSSASGVSTGIGFAGLVKDRYIVGLEYLHKVSKDDLLKVESDNLNLKFGVQFL